MTLEVKDKETESSEIPATGHAPLAPRALGRSVTVVGPMKPKSLYEDPHAKNGRRELGMPMFNWFYNSPAVDAFGRISGPTGTVDRKNVLSGVVRSAPKGKVNPSRVVADPVMMTKHIKKVVMAFGAGQVGIARVHPSLTYVAGSSEQGVVETPAAMAGPQQDDPEELAQKYPYAICWLLPWDYHLGRAHRHVLGDVAYGMSQQEGAVLAANIAGYVRELGYAAIEGKGNSIPLAMAAGLGELGRHGLLISKKFGSRVHPNLIFTDMPLVLDEPIDIGVKEFCAICNKCAVSCPTNSITFGEKVVLNGVEKYKINWKTCYGIRPYMSKFWRLCLTCVTVCPYTKPNVWWRSLAVWLLGATPPPLRTLLVARPLRLLDDLVWGKIPRPRVKWLGYDTGKQPTTEPGCTIAGCSCHAEEHIEEKRGYYAPLTENARRFEIRKARITSGR